MLPVCSANIFYITFFFESSYCVRAIILKVTAKNCRQTATTHHHKASCDLRAQSVFNMYVVSSHQWSSMGATMMNSDRWHMLGEKMDSWVWRSDQISFKIKLRQLRHTYACTYIHLYCQHLLCLVWAHCSVIVSDKFQQGERDASSIWKQWFDKFET